MWGLAYYLYALPLMQGVTCGVGYNGKENSGPLAAMCNFGYLENSAYGFQQMASRPIIIFETVLSICSIAAFNSFGIATTKYASAAQRSTIDTSRTVLIWVLSASLGLQPWELWSLVGFFMLAGGTLVFNEIIVIPFLGFDSYTADAIAKRKNKDGAQDQDENYLSLSPHAAYDSKRNERGLHNELNATYTTVDTPES